MGGGPPDFPQGFSCPAVLRILPLCSGFAYGAFTLSGRLSQNRSAAVPVTSAVHNPGGRIRRFRLLPVRSPLLGKSIVSFQKHCFFLFLRVLRCFSSPGSLPHAMDSRTDDRGLLCRVSPFRHPRISGYLLLPAAFRSLSRLSSALSAKASTLRSLLLDLTAWPEVEPYVLPSSVTAVRFVSCCFVSWMSDLA